MNEYDLQTQNNYKIIKLYICKYLIEHNYTVI